MSAEQLTQIMSNIDRVGMLVTAVLILLVVIGIALMMAHRKIAKNEVELADLIRQAVDKIESDLPKK
jgi:hypothetical protein